MQDESEIIERIGRGNHDAFGEVYDKYAASIYRYISFRISHAQDVEDILSDVFLKLFEACIHKKKVSHLRAFLYQSARNAIVDYYRKRARVEQYETEEDDERGTRHDTGASIDMRIEITRVQEGMRMLKREYQEVIQLRFIEDLDIKEIAMTLDKSIVGVRVLLHRAVNALKKNIQSHE